MVKFVMHRLHSIAALTLVLMLGMPSSAFAAVQAQLDRATIYNNETTHLTITLSGGDDGEPDLAPLRQDFDILSQQQSSSYQWINGQNNSSKSWQLTLRPKRTGQLSIPSLQVGALRTARLLLQVEDANAALPGQPSAAEKQGLWMELSATPERALVQQQIIVSVKIYQAINLNQAQLSDLQADHAVVKAFDKDLNYQQSRNGRMWNVTERKFALFPQQHGDISLAPMQLDGNVQVQASGNRFFPSLQPIHVQSNALTLHVDGIPANWRGGDWLPATRVTLRESWPAQGSIKVGDPITRSIHLQADSALDSQLPDLTASSLSLLPPQLKAYPEKPALSTSLQGGNMQAIREEKLAIIASQPGHYSLPEIRLPWWNTTTKRIEYATLPARQFDVIAAAGNSSASQPTTGMTQTTPAPTTSPLQNSEKPADAGAITADWWQPLALIALTGWLCTLLALLYVLYLRPRLNNTTPARAKPATKKLKQQFTKAAAAHDAAASEIALLAYAHSQPATVDCHTLSSLAARVEEPLQSQLHQLEAARYAPDNNDWNGQALLAAFEQTAWPDVETGRASKKPALPPLYPD